MPGRTSFLASVFALGDYLVSVLLVKLLSSIARGLIIIIATLRSFEYKVRWEGMAWGAMLRERVVIFKTCSPCNLQKVFKWSLWLLKNWWYVVVGDYEEVGKLLDFMDRIEEERRRMTFIKNFHHLKPEHLKMSRSIAENIVNTLVRKAVDKSDESEGVNDIKIRDDEMQSEAKALNKKDDESGFFEEETVPNTSFVM